MSGGIWEIPAEMGRFIGDADECTRIRVIERGHMARDEWVRSNGTKGKGDRNGRINTLGPPQVAFLQNFLRGVPFPVRSATHVARLLVSHLP